LETSIKENFYLMSFITSSHHH